MKQSNLGRKLKTEYIGAGVSAAFGFLIIVMVAAIFGFLVYKGGASFWTHGHSVSQFLFSSNWKPGEQDNIGTIGANIYIVSSIEVSFLALLIATPFAVATAIFINDISPSLGNKIMRPAIEMFVGIPSVVYGWIGLSILVPFIKNLFNLTVGLSILSAGIVLAVMIYPTITSVASDALASTPPEYKEASYALGSTRWQYIWKVKLRAALTGILTGVVLGLARAFGEALAVAMVIGQRNGYAKNLLSSTRNITTVITSSMGDTYPGTDYNDALWSLALLLLIISMFFIVVIRIIGKRGAKAHE